jgi:hypothetical protein
VLTGHLIPSITSPTRTADFPHITLVLLFALKYMHFLLVNLLARFLILFKARYTLFMLFVLSSFTYIIRLASHETTRKYLKPRINAK